MPFAFGDLAGQVELLAQAERSVKALQSGSRPVVMAKIFPASSFEVALRDHDALPDPARAEGRHNRRIRKRIHMRDPS